MINRLATPRTLATALLLSGLAFACSGAAAPPAAPPAPPAAAAATEPTADATAAADKTAAAAADQAAMMKEAKISDSAARATALKAVPNGVIKEGGLEHEDSQLIYSFDIAVEGKTGIEEVTIDAKTGKLLSKTHETPAAEAKEAKEDSSKVKPAGAGGVKKP